MLKHLVRGAVVGVMLACAFGCSVGDDDDDSDGDDDSVDSAATGKCNQLVDIYCPAIIDCAVGAGTIPAADRDATVSQCVTGAKQALDCSKAVDVSSSYDACIDALENPDCDAINDALASEGSVSPLPTVCNGVILVQ